MGSFQSSKAADLYVTQGHPERKNIIMLSCLRHWRWRSTRLKSTRPRTLTSSCRTLSCSTWWVGRLRRSPFIISQHLSLKTQWWTFQSPGMSFFVLLTNSWMSRHGHSCWKLTMSRQTVNICTIWISMNNGVMTLRAWTHLGLHMHRPLKLGSLRSASSSTLTPADVAQEICSGSLMRWRKSLIWSTSTLSPWIWWSTRFGVTSADLPLKPCGSRLSDRDKWSASLRAHPVAHGPSRVARWTERWRPQGGPALESFGHSTNCGDLTHFHFVRWNRSWMDTFCWASASMRWCFSPSREALEYLNIQVNQMIQTQQAFGDCLCWGCCSNSQALGCWHAPRAC